MSITDPMVPKFNWRKGYWYVLRGHETFYDENDEMITFKTEAEAMHWIDKYQQERRLKKGAESPE